ncbi:serine/threonine-protein kinase S6KL-like [Amphibalanus amphitrite]|uniref:serine/threonine-protein kinase S6KL-like n=1 Tax=Amphibalanus amphitrite TaxID=1232801 RepID=UPI001C903F15|nr:serine/threonine-protein kinase S6KL-like [Amphibalanus amphitrite]XP_043205341.1 serine/threonine-protein kinase S6KL-like [Amphibalanus amphitrite]
MGASHMKPSTQSEPVNLRELVSGPKHVSFADETSSQSQLSWHNVSGRLSVLGGRLSRLSNLSWGSSRSGPASPRSPVRPWSRVSRTRWSQATLEDPLVGCKTAWPVSLVESLFLPDFPVRKHCHQTIFSVEKTLGTGAFGKVYQVKHKESGELFALKILSKAHVVREGAVGQVRDEVSIQVACGHHPYIVSCPDRWQTRKQLYVLQELVPGGELRDLWLRHGSLHEQLVQLYVAEMAIALEFLHNAGVIFRDLKLENVLLDSEMHVKLIDFGLAKWLRFGNRTQTLCGTLQYMAPEVLEPQPYNHSVDWWSLGVVAFCLLSGNYPVPAAQDHVEMRCLLLSAQPRLPCHVSAPARALVARLLTPEPRHRLNSLLKLSREAWYANFNLDAVKAREVSARSIYDTFYPAGADASAGSESGRESDFIDFDATTVDESLGSCELVDEFPTLAGSPRRPVPAAVAASTPCRPAAAPAPELSLSPVSADSVVASSGVLSPHRTFRPPESRGRDVRPPVVAEGALVPAEAPHTPPLRAMQDTFEESSSGDILELRLPDAPSDSAECQCDLDVPELSPPAAAPPPAPVLNFYGCHEAGLGEGGEMERTGEGALFDAGPSQIATCVVTEDSLKRPGSSPVSRDEYDRIWKRPRTTAVADSWDDTDVSTEAVQV